MRSATSPTTYDQQELFDRSALTSAAAEMDGADYRFLRRRTAPKLSPSSAPSARVVDLFCGVGGITLGIREAARQVGRTMEVPLALDSDPAALSTFEANFHPGTALSEPIERIFEGLPDASLSDRERALRARVGRVDLMVGGPPCQGHSDLNNSTRRDDPKNALYLFMARAAAVFEPRHIMVENVVGALSDKRGVVQVTRHHLEQLGYETSLGVVDLHTIGVPQARRRVILLASRDGVPPVDDLAAEYATEVRDLRWAIGDLTDRWSSSILDQSSSPSADNRARIRYLFDHDLYDLPDEMRPPCHRHGNHSYNSIYGRLDWDKPAQTITRGFYSTCMGRYVHPSLPRTLTAHEAARIQFFPDFFDFDPVPNRTSLARLIGNAVPPKLGFVAARELLGRGRT